MLLQIFSLFSKGVEKAYAHVGYVVEEEAMRSVAGKDFGYLSSALTTNNILLALGVSVVLLFFIIVIPKFSFWKKFEIHVENRLSTYGDFLPWMARLSLGIALMGAGTAGVFFSPVLPAFSPIPFVEILLGFFFLTGFLLIPATLFTIALFVVTLFGDSYLIGNLDLLGLLFAYLALHSERPGVDDIFNFKVLNSLRLPRRFAALFLRAGIGIAMIYLALYEKILNPLFSDLVVNDFNLQSVVPVSASMWVLSVGIIELVVGLCLLFGYYTRLVSVVAFFILSMSFFYFKEDVYSHVTLFGVLSMIFVLGGGAWSLDRWRKKPVLDEIKN
jgi:uncharacterized membrane protein YphA (DoxX/SURF4 family)